MLHPGWRNLAYWTARLPWLALNHPEGQSFGVQPQKVIKATTQTTKNVEVGLLVPYCELAVLTTCHCWATECYKWKEKK